MSFVNVSFLIKSSTFIINFYGRRKSTRVFNISGLSKFKNTSDCPVDLDEPDISQPIVKSITNDQVGIESSSNLKLKDDSERVEGDDVQGNVVLDIAKEIQNSPSLSDSPGKRKFTKNMVRQRVVDPLEAADKNKSVDDSEKVLEEIVRADPIDDSKVDEGVSQVKKKKKAVTVKNEKGLKGERKGKKKVDDQDVNESVKTDLQIVPVDTSVSKESVKDEDLKVVKPKRKGKQSVDKQEEEKLSVKEEDVKVVKRQRRGKQVVKSEDEEKPTISF